MPSTCVRLFGVKCIQFFVIFFIIVGISQLLAGISVMYIIIIIIIIIIITIIIIYRTPEAEAKCEISVQFLTFLCGKFRI